MAQQNIQSRIRGAILMAISNAEGRLVLATGNKSELSVGYCTLYGDTVGGLAVLGDVYKRDVYALARRANRDRRAHPANILDKPPSAELAPDQLDSDDLPPYDVLDPILEQLVEGGLTGAAAIAPPAGRQREGRARRSPARVDRNEYKRRQAPLVLRTSPKAFGSGPAPADRPPLRTAKARAGGDRFRDPLGSGGSGRAASETARTFSARAPRGPSWTTYSTTSPSEGVVVVAAEAGAVEEDLLAVVAAHEAEAAVAHQLLDLAPSPWGPLGTGRAGAWPPRRLRPRGTAAAL